MNRVSPRARRQRGYTLIELLMTLMTVHLITLMAGVQISSVLASERVNMAGQEVISALRYARQLSLSTGTPCGVIFDMTNQTISVFQGTQSNVAVNKQMPGGKYIVRLDSQANVAGVKITQLNLAPTTATNVVTYGLIGPTSNLPRRLGTTSNTGFVYLKSGSTTRTVAISAVREPSLQ